MRCLAGSRFHGGSRDPVAERRIPSTVCEQTTAFPERLTIRYDSFLQIVSSMRRLSDVTIRRAALSTVRRRFDRTPVKLDQ